LYEDSSAELVISEARCIDDEEKSVLERKVITLTQDEIDYLIKQAESQEFMKAKAEYSAGRSSVDMSIRTVVVYRKAEMEKRVEVKNGSYIDCPEPVRRIIFKAMGLTRQAKEHF
jgi:hypothetical protein